MRYSLLARRPDRRRDTRRLHGRRARSERADCPRRAANSVQLARHHAGDRYSDDPRHAWRRFLVSRIEWRAAYLPDFEYSGRLELLVWSIPAMTVLLVGGVAWVGSHDLDPGKPISSTVKPVNVQVVSLDWKWLFIYPEQGIASVNKLVVPVGTPISFELTSSSVMNSFFVPQLGSQIYTMSGMATRLHLQADHLGTYPGLSTMFSGDGFSDMRFTVDAVTDDGFAQWVRQTRETGSALDKQAYADLVKPSKAVAPFTYRAVAPDLFSSIVNAGMGTQESSLSICSTSQRAER